ncbi:unnamed protein product [marine sediment metagenome]|uniref:Uncharacterized protein n=1 Tax=marine sediment metagenome TaxID=412755 RepID=X1U574_9ZZZZ
MGKTPDVYLGNGIVASRKGKRIVLAWRSTTGQVNTPLISLTSAMFKALIAFEATCNERTIANNVPD